jgi:hypothetical protein
MFEPGTHVVCIDDTFPPSSAKYFEKLPVRGEIYTVRDIIPAQGWNGGHTCAVLLGEIRNPPPSHRPQWGECGFSPDRFREIQINETQASECNSRSLGSFNNLIPR